MAVITLGSTVAGVFIGATIGNIIAGGIFVPDEEVIASGKEVIKENLPPSFAEWALEKIGEMEAGTRGDFFSAEQLWNISGIDPQYLDGLTQEEKEIYNNMIKELKSQGNYAARTALNLTGATLGGAGGYAVGKMIEERREEKEYERELKAEERALRREQMRAKYAIPSPPPSWQERDYNGHEGGMSRA